MIRLGCRRRRRMLCGSCRHTTSRSRIHFRYVRGITHRIHSSGTTTTTTKSTTTKRE